MNRGRRKMDRVYNFLKCYVMSLLLLNLAACSSMQPVNVENAMQSSRARGIDYGSLVEVKTLDKRTVTFRVTEINEEGLGGSKGFFRYEEMKSLRVESPGANQNDRALSWILGALGVVALVALVVSADSVRVCSPSPCPEPPQ